MFTITPRTVKASPEEFQSAKSKGPFLSCLGEAAWDSGNILQAGGAYGVGVWVHQANAEVGP